MIRFGRRILIPKVSFGATGMQRTGIMSKIRYLSRKANSDNESWDDALLQRTLRTNRSSENGSLKCTIFDSSGEIVSHGKSIKRNEFMKMYNLVPRDFRKLSRHAHLDTGGGSNLFSIDMVPTISTRNDTILLQLLNVRALIKHDTVVIFDTFGVSSSDVGINRSHSHALFIKEMKEKLSMASDLKDLTYEITALESILIHVLSNLTLEMNVHKGVLKNILDGLDNSIDNIKLKYLLAQSKKIAQFHQKSSLLRDLLESILESDDDLNDMYLTDKFNGTPREGTNHTELEFLLETYYKTSDEIVQTVEDLMSQIKTTEEIIRTVLDANRNELMLLGLKFSVILLSSAACLYVAALYGMNLENFIEEENGGFELITTLGIMILAVIFVYSTRQLMKVQRITMSNSGLKRRKSKYQ